MATWNKQELDLVLNNIHLSTSDIFARYCKSFGEDTRTYDSVQKKVRALKDDPPQDLLPTAWTPAHPAPLLVVQPEHAADLPTKNEVEEWLLNNIAAWDPQPVVPVDSDGKSLVIVLSDNHFGKRTETFNLEIARERVLSIPQEIADTHNVNDVDEVIVVLAGDEVEGEDIYANQNGGLECPVILQAKAAAEAYWQLVLVLRETYQSPIRVVTCPGNHGRMSKTADVRSNWDNVVYMMLATLIEQNPELDIHMELNFDEFAEFIVKGKKGLAYHYGTKHLGTPAMQVKMAGWIVSKQIDFLMHGHWHHWGIESWMGKPMVHNGCLCGPDDLAEKMAVEERPRQGYFFVERDKPIRVFSFCEW